MENRNLAFKLILFICWPFGALIATLNRLKSTTFYVIYFLFCVLFCWHMNPVHLDRYDDLMGIAGTFMFNVIPTEVLLQQIQDYFTFSPNAPRELYINILCWFVHQFSNNPHVFFAVASIPFLIFQTKSFKLITDDNKFKNGSLLCFLVLFLFMLPRDIITVQNPRFTTALWMSVYAILKFWGEGYRKFKYVFLLCLTPLDRKSVV